MRHMCKAVQAWKRAPRMQCSAISGSSKELLGLEDGPQTWPHLVNKNAKS